MNKQTTTGIAQFLDRVDEREYINVGRGKVIVRSDGAGTATVKILLSPMHGRVENPVLGPFASVGTLCDGIFKALKALDGEKESESAYEHFVHMISKRVKYSS